MRAAALRLLASLLLAALAAGCGGGGGGGGGADPPTPVLHDDTPYSTAANASLPSGERGVGDDDRQGDDRRRRRSTTSPPPAISTRSRRSRRRRRPRCSTSPTSARRRPARCGRWSSSTTAARARPASGCTSARSRRGASSPARRRRRVPQPFQLVDNAESLIDVADLVFVDAVGSGYSQAIAPFTNRSFWGVDSDAALMRDFIARYVAVNQRAGVARLPVRRVVRRPALGRARPAHARRRDAARRRDPAVAGPRLQLELRRVRAGDDQLRRLPPELRPDRRLVRADPAGADRCRRLRRTSCATSPPPPTDRRRRPGPQTRTPASAALLEPAGRPHRRAARRLDRQRRPRCPRPFATGCAPASCSAATTRASPRRSAARWRRRAIRRRP